MNAAIAPSITSDTEAREIARRHFPNGADTAGGRFATTGAIQCEATAFGHLANHVAQRARFARTVDHDDAAETELLALYAYVAFHGERGPVDSWGDPVDDPDDLADELHRAGWPIAALAIRGGWAKASEIENRIRRSAELRGPDALDEAAEVLAILAEAQRANS